VTSVTYISGCIACWKHEDGVDCTSSFHNIPTNANEARQQIVSLPSKLKKLILNLLRWLGGYLVIYSLNKMKYYKNLYVVASLLRR